MERTVERHTATISAASESSSSLDVNSALESSEGKGGVQQSTELIAAPQTDLFAMISQILIFPEGTDLSPSNVDKSNKFAETHHLPPFTRVLHPKTTGFTFLCKRLFENNQLDAIYDLTVAYVGNLPQSECDALYGNFPSEAHFNIKRYDTSKLSVSDTESMKTWLKEIWSEKEERLNEFYSRGSFDDQSYRRQPLSNSLHLSLLFWTLLQLLLVYGLCCSHFIRCLVLLSSSIMLLLSFASRGVQDLEVKWYRLVKSCFH